MNFAIAGMGRSGTKSLAHVLRESKECAKVYHERDNEVITETEIFNDRAKSDNYGEVSSYLRYVLPYIKADKKAVIIRNPYDIISSGIRRGGEESEILWKVGKGLVDVDYCIGAGAKIIVFEKMVSDEEYRQKEIYEYLGLTINTTFPHIDPSPQKDTSSWQLWKPFVGWFEEKYYSTN